MERKSSWPKPLTALLPPVLRPAFRKRSPATARIASDWALLVGPELAARTEPRKVAAGVLTLACDGPTALELQYAEARLAERINQGLGERVVARIRFVQAPVAPPAPVRQRRPVVPGAPVEGVGEELGLRLARLRAAIAARDAGGA